MGEVEDGWWKGRSAGRVGVFPSNFVEMCSDEKQQVSVDERNSKNIIQSAKTNNESDKTSTKAPQPEESITITKQSPQSQKSEDSRKSSLSTSQRSQIGPDSPAPDTAPRLPPKPGKKMISALGVSKLAFSAFEIVFLVLTHHINCHE